MPSLPPGEREWLVRVIQGVEERVGKRLTDVEERLAAVERSTQASVVNTQTMGHLSEDVEELTKQVRAVLSQTIRQSRADFEQDRQILELEQRIQKRSTKNSAITASTIAAVITIAAQVAEKVL